MVTLPDDELAVKHREYLDAVEKHGGVRAASGE